MKQEGAWLFKGQIEAVWLESRGRVGGAAMGAIVGTDHMAGEGGTALGLQVWALEQDT